MKKWHYPIIPTLGQRFGIFQNRALIIFRENQFVCIVFLQMLVVGEMRIFSFSAVSCRILVVQQFSVGDGGGLP